MDLEVNARLKKLRKENGFTQAQIGKVLGMGQNAYSSLEQRGRVNTLVLKRLAEFYDVDVKYILYGEETEAPQITEPPKIKPCKPEIIVSYSSEEFQISVMESLIIETIRNLNEKDKQEVLDVIYRKKFKK